MPPIDIHQGLLQEEHEMLAKEDGSSHLSFDDLKDLEEVSTYRMLLLCLFN